MPVLERERWDQQVTITVENKFKRSSELHEDKEMHKPFWGWWLTRVELNFIGGWNLILEVGVQRNSTTFSSKYGASISSLKWYQKRRSWERKRPHLFARIRKFFFFFFLLCIFLCLLSPIPSCYWRWHSHLYPLFWGTYFVPDCSAWSFL